MLKASPMADILSLARLTYKERKLDYLVHLIDKRVGHSFTDWQDMRDSANFIMWTHTCTQKPAKYCSACDLQRTEPDYEGWLRIHIQNGRRPNLERLYAELTENRNHDYLVDLIKDINMVI